MDALKEIGADYEKDSGDKVIFNFAASSTLARQIEEGAPADIFFSADEAKMDALEKKGLILKDTRTNRLSNCLVLVVPAQGGPALSSLKDLSLPGIKRIALAEPRTVPAGIYARQYLQKEHLWALVEPKVVPTENVRAALAAVESGNVEAGIVYKTDAAISREVKVAFEIPVGEGPSIRYPMAVVKESRDAAAARKLLEFLNSDPSANVFRARGFIVLP
jgi:molybdate transport system substrate-binding protein